MSTDSTGWKAGEEPIPAALHNQNNFAKQRPVDHAAHAIFLSVPIVIPTYAGLQPSHLADNVLPLSSQAISCLLQAAQAVLQLLQSFCHLQSLPQSALHAMTARLYEGWHTQKANTNFNLTEPPKFH